MWFDADGLAELHPTEHELAQAALRRAAALGLEAAIGIAGSKVTAELAARDGGGCAVVPARDEWRVLAPLSLELLSPPPALRETLTRWGIRTLGDLAALPASAVATRLGPEAAALARRARGEDAHPLAPRPLPLQFEEVAELDWGVDALEPFLFVVRGLLDRLLARLEVRGLVCGDLRLSLGLADRGRDERTVTVAAPSNALQGAADPGARPPRGAPAARRGGDACAWQRCPSACARRSSISSAPPVRRRRSWRRPWRGSAPCAATARSARRRSSTRTGRMPTAWRRSPPRRAPRRRRRRRPRCRSPCARCDRRGCWRCSASATSRTSCAAPPTATPTARAASSPSPAPGASPANGGAPATSSSRDYYDAQLTDGGVYRLYFDHTCRQWFLDGVYD